jgi:hypothetical protein
MFPILHAKMTQKNSEKNRWDNTQVHHAKPCTHMQGMAIGNGLNQKGYWGTRLD